jgi:hypothetical protein
MLLVDERLYPVNVPVEVEWLSALHETLKRITRGCKFVVGAYRAPRRRSALRTTAAAKAMVGGQERHVNSLFFKQASVLLKLLSHLQSARAKEKNKQKCNAHRSQ